ncbi:MAG TPA: amino acid adenylation domain-containing protein, partial [Thermoanaerobaculia bacterium]|nr:amino acid adenylation domain-containing protein [Thermoanaerobaculia bacterium]
LSFAQRRLWFLHRLSPWSASYNVPAALRLSGRLDPEALRRSFEEVARRHEVLRTVYVSAGEEPVQIVLPAGPVPLPRVDLAALDEEARERELGRLIAEETGRPFDLEHGPVLRVTLVRLGEGEQALLLTLHHIASDGWSMGVLLHELEALYPTYREGRPSPLPEPPVQYADYAVWQREWLAGEVLARQLAYWRERLAGMPAFLDLPADRPRPAALTGRGASLPLRLSPDLVAALRDVGRRARATLFMVLAAGAEALLGRYTGEKDFSLGSPVAGRRRWETEELIGCFLNTLVLRADLAGDPAFGDLLDRVRGGSLGAYAHQDLPFERLVEELQPQRDLSRHPLFQVSLVLQNVPLPELELPDVRMVPLALSSVGAKFDLSVVLIERKEELDGFLEFNADLFDVATVGRLARHLESLLAAAARAPEARVSSLRLLVEPEAHQVLVEWNADRWPRVGRELCLHQCFEAEAGRRPQAVALVTPSGREVSYGELEGRAHRLARRLRRLGVGPEVRVGVCLERSDEMVVSLLAVLKAGGAYLPLDPSYPHERLSFMLRDGGAAVLLACRPLPGGLEVEIPVVEPGAGEAERAAGEDDGRLAPLAGADNLAYVIYTSGSTGRPKGVAIAHRSAVELVFWARRVFSAEELSGVLASTSICFDLSVFELFAPLSWGGCVLLAPNVLELAQLPSASRVRLLNTVPSALSALAEGELPADLGTINLAGEALGASLVERLWRRHPQVRRVLNLYGPSEDTTYSTGSEVRLGERVTIGRPLPGTAAYVLDAGLAPLPAGVAGELLLSGCGLARGYLGRPELTAERFLPDPYGEPGSRMYRTGDLVRRLPDGRIDFLGRIDHQVKVRGFRVELGEIEANLARHPAVGAAAVLAREDVVPGEKVLVAYVAPAGGGVAVADELRAWLQSRLPEPLVPAWFVIQAELPLTPNGKVDRKSLPAPEVERGAAVEGPRTPAEEIVAAIWSEVLGIEVCGRHESFFALGGHSLAATRVISRLQRACGLDLPVVRMFEAPTVAQLAAVVDRELAGGASRQAPP